MPVERKPGISAAAGGKISGKNNEKLVAEIATRDTISKVGGGNNSPLESECDTPQEF